MIYQIQPNWFEGYIRPRAVRRAIGAFVVAVAVFASSLVPGYRWAIGIAIAAFLFGVFDLVQLKSTRSMVESLKISVSPQGLSFIFGPKQTEVLYPWHTLVVSRVKFDGDLVMSFVVRDRERKRSHVSVIGYENIDGLLKTVQDKLSNA